MSSRNVYEYNLSTPLEFQEGDILGVYQPQDEEFRVYYQDDAGPENYRESRTSSASTFFTRL